MNSYSAASQQAARRVGRARWVSAAVILAAFSGCAHYQRKPLATKPDLASALPALVASPQALLLPGVRPRTFDPRHGLSATETAQFAVMADPALRALRDRRGIARAQLFAAGLLPDPQLTVSGSRVLSVAPGLYDPRSLALTEALGRLITRSDAKAAAGAHVRQVNLEVLWQEWQVAARARVLWTELRLDRREQRLLQRETVFYRAGIVAYGRAAAAGALTDLELARWQSAAVRVQDSQGRVRRREQAAAANLRLLLGLSDRVPLVLHGPVHRALPTASTVTRALRALPTRRPDLRALAAGYRSANERLRMEILAQFPGISVQLSRARDNSGVNTAGVALDLRLPLFNGNRGRIAIAQATRRALRYQYQARLDESTAEVQRVFRNLVSMAREQRAVGGPQLATLRGVARRSRRAYGAGALDWNRYALAQQYYFERAMLALRLDRALAEERVTLQTLLGVPDLRAATS